MNGLITCLLQAVCFFISFVQLLKYEFPELLGAVETRLGPLDRVPRKEMRVREFVATLVEVGCHLLATETLYVATEQRSGWYNLYYTP